MKIGVAYHPEQWPEDQWLLDAERMKDFGADVVRIGEFAWSNLEPRRERFEMDWMERAIENLLAQGLEIILCTPTAAPPPWLFHRHESILPMKKDGTRWYMGSKKHACLNNTAYQKYVRRILLELGKRFGNHPDILAWQIDSKLGFGPADICYCGECEQAFRRWLKRRYGTIDRLNRLWGTSFWSQDYVDWHEVPSPRQTTYGQHPSLMLDYRRFVAARYREFVREQREIIAEGAGEKPKITVNEPSWIELPHVDAFSLASEEDFVSLDNYPGDGSGLNSTALGLDFARSTGKGSFWVSEQQAGAIPSGNCAVQPRPGELRLWSYQAAARGAEAIMYFRWRTAAAGQQMHWYGIHDSDGTPRRRFKELKKTVAELKEYSSLWKDAVPDARVAILIDYNSAWALESTPLGVEIDYFEQVKILYGLLRERGICVDFVGIAPSAEEYDLVVAPAPFVCTSKNTSKLHLYVREGGTLFLTAPAGYKTEAGTALETAPPGLLEPIIGVETVEHEVLRDVGENFIVFEKDKAEYPAGRFCSIMELKGAETMAAYKSGHYSGSPAITKNSVDDGMVVYMGTNSSKEGYGILMDELLDIADIPRRDTEQSQGVEYIPLTEESGERKLVFVLNHTSETAELDLGEWEGGAEDVLGRRRYEGNIVIDPFDVLLLRKGQ